jgi:hypothetical protein
MSELTSQYSREQLARLRLASNAFAIMAFGIGSAALLGWILDNDFLKRIYPSLVTMKASTAVCLILTAFSLLALQDQSASSLRKRLGQVLALVVAIVGLLTLSEHIFGWNLGFDQLIFRESVAEAGRSFPGRMGVATSLDFFFLGMALLFLDARPSRGFSLSNAPILIVVLTTLLVFLYYIYGIEKLEPIAPYFNIALHTVVALFCIRSEFSRSWRFSRRHGSSRWPGACLPGCRAG